MHQSRFGLSKRHVDAAQLQRDWCGSMTRIRRSCYLTLEDDHENISPFRNCRGVRMGYRR